MVPTVFLQFSQKNQQELLQIFNEITSEDNSAQIRKQAALVLNQMIKMIPKVSETELLTIFNKVFKDEQDSVRMHGIECCVSFA